jgi:hypothetical protein
VSTASKAIAGLIGALRPGGVCIVHMLNLLRLPEGPTTWQKFKRFDDDGMAAIIIRGIHRIGLRGFIDLVRLRISDDGLEHQARAAEILGFAGDDLLRAASGADIARLYGNYEFEPFEPDKSVDLILVCRRGAD